MKKDDKFLDHMCIKIPGILNIKKEYHTKGGNSRYSSQFMTLNYTEMLIENYKEGDYGEIFGEEVAQNSSIPSNVSGNVDVKYSFGVSSIHIGNMKVSKYLMFHSIINHQTFNKLRTLSLTNSPITEELLCLLLEYTKNFSPQLDTLELHKIHLSVNVITAICAVLKKCQVKNLVIKMCGIRSKQFGEICLGILEGKTVECMDFSSNLIGKF